MASQNAKYCEHKGSQCDKDASVTRSRHILLLSVTAAASLLICLALAISSIKLDVPAGLSPTQRPKSHAFALCHPCIDTCGVTGRDGGQLDTLLKGPTQCRAGFCVPKSVLDPAAFCTPLAAAPVYEQERRPAVAATRPQTASRKYLQYDDDKDLSALTALPTSQLDPIGRKKTRHSRRQLEARFEKYFSLRAERAWNVGEAASSKASQYLSVIRHQLD